MKKTMKKIEAKERAVVICTARRAVVFGYTTLAGDEIIAATRTTLARARMCTYWSKETRGVLGLAAVGPQAGSRIGPAVPQATLESITAVLICSPEAARAWEEGPWS